MDVDFVGVGGFRGFRFLCSGFRYLGSGFRGNKWISWISRISLFRQTVDGTAEICRAQTLTHTDKLTAGLEEVSCAGENGRE